MRQRHNPSVTKMFAGYRMIKKKINGKIKSFPTMPKLQLTKNLFKEFEKAQVLTKLQHNIVDVHLERCNEKTAPDYVARLYALLEKPIIDVEEEE